MKHLTLIFICLSFISCGNLSENYRGIGATDFVSKVQLVKQGQLIIELDSVTPPRVTSYVYLPDEEALVIMNVINNSLYKYNLNSGELMSIETFPKEGPEGVGQFANTTEFVYQGDSIFFHDRSRRTLVIVGASRNVIYKTAFSKKYDSTPYGMWDNWINPYENGYSMSGAPTRSALKIVPDELDSLEFFFDPKDSSLTRLYMPIPEVYKGERWLPEVMRYFRQYNLRKKEYIYSWPISDSIYIKDAFGHLRSSYMGTNNYVRNVPLPSDVEPYVFNQKRKLDYYYEQGEYNFLYYDQFRNMLFRYAFSGIKDGQVDINTPFKDKNLFDRTLIISDGEYNKVGEFSADIYVPYVAVFTKDHILLLRETEDEDYLVFDQFKVDYNE